MRVGEADTPNTALETRYGHFDFIEVPFRFNECASEIQGSQVEGVPTISRSGCSSLCGKTF